MRSRGPRFQHVGDVGARTWRGLAQSNARALGNICAKHVRVSARAHRRTIPKVQKRYDKEMGKKVSNTVQFQGFLNEKTILSTFNHQIHDFQKNHN